jgi:hypothetical protein
MSMDMYTLYSEAAASFILHGALVFAVIAALGRMNLELGSTPYVGMFVIGIAAGSAIINGGLLTVLHQFSCGGVTNPLGIVKGAGVSAGISAIMSVLPTYIEPLRLAVSSIVMTHKYLGTPDRITAEGALKDAAATVHAAAHPEGTLAPEVATPLPSDGVGSLPELEYALQTFQEARVASAYLTAFAGAYGLAIGAQWTSQCKP